MVYMVVNGRSVLYSSKWYHKVEEFYWDVQDYYSDLDIVEEEEDDNEE